MLVCQRRRGLKTRQCTGADPEGVHWVPVNLPPLRIKYEKVLLGIKSKNASSLLLCLPI